MFRFLSISLLISVIFVSACTFSEYVQSDQVAENIDDYRTGCEVDADVLMAGYKWHEANQFHFDSGLGTPIPTPTSSPITDDEVALSALLEKVWENGCQTGRRDATSADQAALMSLRDHLSILDARLSAIETPTPQE